MNPILIVAAVAVAGFLIALVAFRGSGSSNSAQSQKLVPPSQAASQAASSASQGSDCGAGQPDPTYTVSVGSDPNPPRAEGTTFHLIVQHDGKAVTGATVCLAADMTQMHHEGINNAAKETSAGEYDTVLRFGMRGPYKGTVIVAEPGKPAVSVPVSFPVG